MLSIVANSSEEGYGCCGIILLALSFLLMLATLPVSIFMCIKVKLLKKGAHNFQNNPL